MFQERWVAATTPATVAAFAYVDKDGKAANMHVDAVSWTSPRWPFEACGPATT